MERAIVFDDYNTWTDWGLILTGKDIPLPQIKTNYVSIDGMSGSVDLTEALSSEVTYEDVPLTFTFCASEGSHEEREALLRAISAAVHGRKLKIIEPDDPHHYFYGRASVTNIVRHGTHTEFAVACICAPWRFDMQETVIVLSVSAATDRLFTVRNPGVRVVCPDLTVTGSLKITCNGVTSSATAGTYKVLTFKLFPGENPITISGTGTLTLTYRGGTL